MTASSNVPVVRFGNMKNKFRIRWVHDVDKLPEAQTCFKQLICLITSCPQSWKKVKMPVDLLPEDVWNFVNALPDVSKAFEAIQQHVKTNLKKWKAYYVHNEPETIDLTIKANITRFEKLILLRVWHLRRVREGLCIFVTKSLAVSHFCDKINYF